MLERLSVNTLPMKQGLGTTVQEPDSEQGFMPKLPGKRGGECTQVVPRGKKHKCRFKSVRYVVKSSQTDTWLSLIASYSHIV